MAQKSKDINNCKTTIYSITIKPEYIVMRVKLPLWELSEEAAYGLEIVLHDILENVISNYWAPFALSVEEA